jgi:hypothetical protein
MTINDIQQDCASMMMNNTILIKKSSEQMDGKSKSRYAIKVAPCKSKWQVVITTGGRKQKLLAEHVILVNGAITYKKLISDKNYIFEVIVENGRHEMDEKTLVIKIWDIDKE